MGSQRGSIKSTCRSFGPSSGHLSQAMAASGICTSFPLESLFRTGRIMTDMHPQGIFADGQLCLTRMPRGEFSLCFNVQHRTAAYEPVRSIR